MKLGTFYEHQLPRPWKEGSELKLFQDALDQVELADKLGIDHMWEVEHHFLEEYAHSSAPEIFLAACQSAHQADSARPRHRAAAARIQSSGAGGGANRDARPGERRARRVRHRRIVGGARTRRLSAFRAPTSATCGRSRSARSRGCSSRIRSSGMRESTSRCRCATWCRSRCRSRIRRCGSRARGARPSTSRPSSESAR